MLSRRAILVGASASLLPKPAFAACTPLLTNTTVYSTPSKTKPSYLSSYIDSIFGTTVQRITGDPGASIPNITGGKWGDVCRVGYSKRAPWNCDGSIMWLETNKYAYGSGTVGTSGGIFLDGNDYTPLFDGDGKPSSSDCRWHPTDPNLMFYIKGTGEFGTWNVQTGALDVIHTFTGYTDMRIGIGEGNYSLNGDVFVFSARKPSGVYICFAYKISTDTKYAEIDTNATLGGAIDNATVNLDGNRIIVQYDPENIAIFNFSGVLQYDFGLPEAHPSHWDISETDTGSAVVIGVAKGSPNSGKVIRRKISDGSTTVLTTGSSYASHSSCRAVGLASIGVPAVVSYEKQVSYPLYSGEIVIVNAGGLNVWRLCHTHNEKQEYESETRGVPDPLLTKVAFSSNWHDSGSVQTYVCTIAPRCPIVPPGP